MDECNGAGAINGAWNALREPSNFFSICAFPGVTVVGICNKMSVLHSLTGLLVVYSMEHVSWEMLFCCLQGSEVAVVSGYGV